jgi:hypothetical protein
MTGENRPLRRQTSAQLETLRALKRVSKPYQVKLDTWQAHLAGLRVRRLTGLDLDHVATDAAHMVPIVQAARIELTHDAETAGYRVSQHSILRDLDRALLRLVEMADELIDQKSPRAN